ncbi:MAG: NAD(P)H-hydrate dehydratase [Bacteroidetes bacterium]|nr:NAD(P)H-hydrate dehydratase [Bacteroidota bacterium]MBS1541430.1 NAD(P)H-hydrate dehydratase [Bacteroidota bacterium]
MLKILSSPQIKELDRYTIEHEPVAGIDLMERACVAFVDWIAAHIAVDKKIGIVCGTGNNGGDGLGIARLLCERGYVVSVWVVRGTATETEDFNTNLKRLSPAIKPINISVSPDRSSFQHCHVLIDAIFGSGLSRNTSGIYADAISMMNESTALKIAVDIPSGLFADAPSAGTIFQADHTVTFQTAKLAFLLPENEKWVGQMHIVDIGLSQDFLNSAESKNYFIAPGGIKNLIRPRKIFSHKGSYGHGLIIAGSYGKMGACVLAAKASLRAGIGLLTVHISQSGYTILQTSAPEAMVSVDESEYLFTNPPEALNYTSIGIGPGLGTSEETVNALAKTLKHFKKPMVIDADALNILSQNIELLSLIPENSILTPHPKEFERLAGSWQNDFEKLALLRSFSAKTKSIVVLKGAFTSICFPDGNIYFNSTGNPGMATGGSGDVLTGILMSLLSQGYSPTSAALVGVYWHGLAGDCAAHKFSQNTMIASDIITFLPKAFKKIAV